MTEYTTGYISTITNGAVAVVGASTAWNVTGNIDTATYQYYFRVDADGTGDASVWYLVDSSVALGATTLSLAVAYGGTTIGTGTENNTYTISRVPEIPGEFHDYLIYAAAVRGLADESDSNYQFFLALSEKLMNDCKRLYKSRAKNTQFGVEI